MKFLKLSLISIISVLQVSEVISTGGGNFYNTNLGITLDYHRVRLMDYNEAGAGTWLFRSNLPIINGTFAYD